MAISGSPPVYTRDYSFTQHSIDQPQVPQPGDKLDQQFDDIATCIAAYGTAVDGITNEDGSLADGIVGMSQLAPGLFDEIVTDAEAQLQPLVDQAETSARGAQTYADDARFWAGEAQKQADRAEAAASTTEGVADAAITAATDAEDAASRAELDANRAENASSTADAAMQQSLMHMEDSQKWAEYLAGPVQPAPPGWPEAIDGGMWSAKWWAVRASEIVGEWGQWYLGAFADPPTSATGTPYPPGVFYWDIGSNAMLVWTGETWVPMAAPSPSVYASFVYVATAGQQTFTGPDANGNTPAIITAVAPGHDVHVNGVKLARLANGTGDFTVNTADPAHPVLTIAQPLDAGSVVQWDFYMLQDVTAGGAAAIHVFKLIDLDKNPSTGAPGEFDGTKVTFPLRFTNPGTGTTTPAAPLSAMHLRVTLDGVLQDPTVDFNVSASDLTFTEAPPATTRFTGAWLQGAVA